MQESAFRYAFAAGDVRTLRVLDVASGSGLGSEFLLRQGARFVVGVEAAPEGKGPAAKDPKVAKEPNPAKDPKNPKAAKDPNGTKP